MKRKTISLPNDLAAALRREADPRRLPVSQVAREAIEAQRGWGRPMRSVAIVTRRRSGRNTR